MKEEDMRADYERYLERYPVLDPDDSLKALSWDEYRALFVTVFSGVEGEHVRER
jgi:hypothetical protein